MGKDFICRVKSIKVTNLGNYHGAHAIAYSRDAKDWRTDELNFKKILNSKKVSDHHAIIPTETIRSTDVEALPEGEKKILQLAATRIAESVSAPCKYKETVAEVSCLGKTYTLKGKYIADPGWRSVANTKDTAVFFIKYLRSMGFD
ncbi:MAG: hypothetical protein K6B41_12575, partial [Butyrivibrio sp.]|nr:hypothetical protein [Butyrivibrio sp.]